MAEQSVNRPYKGMVTDLSILDQPKDAYLFALNAINESINGDVNFLTSELSNEAILNMPLGMLIIGGVRMANNDICIFGKHSEGNLSYIGILNENDKFEVIVQSSILHFSENYPVKAVFRVRRNQQRVIYFTDGLNKPRIFNFDRLYDYYSSAYKDWLERSPTVGYTAEKWEAIHFELIKSFKSIPEFVKVEVLNTGGSIPSGSYSAAIQLIDENLNPTEWISVSNPVRIYNDSLDTEYNQIRGSRNTSTDAQNFNTSSKSIRWSFSNLDQNFSFYRVAVLQANSGNGVSNQALVSQLIPISNESFTYTGSDSNFTSTPITDILVQSIDIASAKFVTQIENRLILSGIKGKQIDWCAFQAKASKITSELVIEDAILDDVNSIGNPKNPVSSFYLTGYMPEEVYSFGIVYTHKDGTKSPVYHIPGQPVVSGVGTVINYGLLYNWWAMIDSRKLTSSDDWVIPRFVAYTAGHDFEILENYVGAVNIGDKLKDNTGLYWNDTPPITATNETGLTIRGAGWRDKEDGSFKHLRELSKIATNYSFGIDFATALFGSDDPTATLPNENTFDVGYNWEGVSVRLVRTSTTLTHGQSGTYVGNDGKVYKTICIGTQEWLAENLAETMFRNEEYIPGFNADGYVPMTNAAWKALTTAGVCAYNNNLDNAFITTSSGTNMDTYACEDSFYPDVHKCMANDFWGEDAYGNALVNTSIRHHKFPKRNSAMFERRPSEVLQGYTNELRVQLFWVQTPFHPSLFEWIVEYRVDGSTKLGYFQIESDDVSGVIISLGNVEGTNISVIDVRPIPENPDDRPPRIDFTDATLRNVPYYKTVIENVAKTYGIKFSNIEKPHPDIVGFEIVRNERTETDKLVVDNAIIGPLINNKSQAVSSDPYHAFGLLLPHLATPADLSTQGVYIFSPEHQFKNKKLIFDRISITGFYPIINKFLPLRTGTTPNGAYVNDVQAGTTFNSEYHAGGDADGFDLQVFYRSNLMGYTFNESITFPDIEELLYLSASGNKTVDGSIYFNAAVDNKIIIALANVDATALFHTTPRVLAATLLRDNADAYSNFMDRAYYKEHNNVIPFYNTVEESSEIYNGDSYIAPLTINNSTYYDTKFATRDKKSRVWKIVVGSLLIVAAIAVNVIPVAGQAASVALGAAAVATLTTLAVGYGVSLLTSGIQFEVMKKMIDEHYEAGLKVCLEDEDNNDDHYANEIEDDRFCWFTDQLANIYLESSVNIGLRSGLTASVSDFYNNITKVLSDYSGNELSSSAENFESYLINKLTVVDREQTGGRLYTGFATSEIYDINPDYHKLNTEKKFYALPYEYECCSKEIETYPLRNYYSEQSFQEEKLDNYRKFLPNNYRDIQGEYGDITNVFKMGANLMIHTQKALLMLPKNLQERVNSELITFIGTGDFFALEPILTNGNGTESFQSSIETPYGHFYVSTDKNNINIYGDGNQIINNGKNAWFKENLPLTLEKYIRDTFLINFPASNNVSSLGGVGFHAVYDEAYKRVLLTKIDYKPLVEFVPYVAGNVALEDVHCYQIETGLFGIGKLNRAGQLYFEKVPFADTTLFENKSWTLSYSFVSQTWVSYHSYIPRTYLSRPKGLYSYSDVLGLNNILHKHHTKGKFLNFYGRRSPFIIEIVSNGNPTVDKIYNDLYFILDTKAYLENFDDFVEVHDVFFNKIVVYNNFQSTGLKNIRTKYAVMKKNPANFLYNRTVNASDLEIIAAKTNGVWSINRLRNYVDNYDSPLFLKDWDNIRSSYYIDKVVNDNVINLNKKWSELERIKGKYIVIRLIFDNFASANDNVQLTFNYSSQGGDQSLR